MIELRPTDFVPLKDFGRAWRFTDPQYNVLPPNALSDLRPISRPRAAAISIVLEKACGSFHSGSKAPTREIDATCDSDQSRSKIHDALRALPIAPDQRVIVGWDQNDAVEASWRTFFTYWDDFCYPSSDDVTICPVNEEWTLCYHHWERFSFSSGNAAEPTAEADGRR